MIELPESPLLTGSDVLDLIPQGPPIEMVDKLWYIDEKKCVSGLQVHSSNILCVNEEFIEAGLIENIAQTAALKLGYIVRQKQNNGELVDFPVGFIGAIKKLKIHRRPKLGEELITEITEEITLFDITLIDGKVRVDGELIAECKMKIFINSDD